MMGVTKYDYMDLNQFRTRYSGMFKMHGWIWSYMGRTRNNAREWLVFIPAMPDRKFFVFER